MNGALTKAGLASIKPASGGDDAAPVVRATPVTPAAADLPSGLETMGDMKHQYDSF